MPRRHLRLGALRRSSWRALRHTRNPTHVAACARCQAAHLREQQYLERLRGSTVPEASQDLAARLIQQTASLANQRDTLCSARSRQPHVRRSLRITAVFAGTLALSAGALAATAYAVGGDAEPPARTAASDAAPLAGGMATGPAELIFDSTPTPNTASLSPEQIGLLRANGWACPEMAQLGFHVIAARATEVDGNPVVELDLENNGHSATVLEEHMQGQDRGGSGQHDPARLSITQGSPWEAVYTTPSAIIKYTADLPATQAADAVPELVRAGDSMSLASAARPSEAGYQRLLRGLEALLRPAGL
ncbi:hypothetical protein [Arthrobacter sp. efr-133-TYG-104]|uniref:hypothetical protein n=1 Tax=Arthrobacter sp. efr-133-TYG-104 TaxID=3040324 RepID=UPI00254E6E5F|nr:hypothetical protein [Arthrobacter sp. efr-133-TYG-104]